jgi:hypothetical protein
VKQGGRGEKTYMATPVFESQMARDILKTVLAKSEGQF